MVDFCPIQTGSFPIREKILQRVWEMFRPIVFGVSFWFARRWRWFWVNVFARIGEEGRRGQISRSSSFSRSARIDYPWRLKIGERSSIGNGTWVYCLSDIIIGSNCCIGENVKLLTGSHDIQSPTFDLVTKPIIISDNVWIATGAMILPGVTIGRGAVIAAGSVVTKDVAPWTVVGGNPAKFIKKRELRND